MVDMFKNQLQELAQRSCFNLPSYTCIREGPDHAPRFKASVNFNGELFESPSYCTTLRQAEHSAAEVALNALSVKGPSRSLTARVLDETGVYKNLLQETAHRVGLSLPVYTTIRSGPRHIPVFTSTVELACMSFTGDSAKTKKQAEKNAAIAAWSALKRMPNFGSSSLTRKEGHSEENYDQVIVARVLSNLGNRDENRVFRRRDQNQPRRKMLRNHRDNGSSSSPHVQQQQRRLMDLFEDSAAENSRRKKKSFLSLLPPPPPRTISKLLPSDGSAFCQPKTKPGVMGIAQAKRMQEIWPALGERLRDDNLNGRSETIKKLVEMEDCRNSTPNVFQGANSAFNKPFELPCYSGKLEIQLLDQRAANGTTCIDTGNNLLGPKASSEYTGPPMKGVSRPTYTAGYHPQRIAPAVQIRSVIPVCAAAAPVRMRPSSPMKETPLRPRSGAELMQVATRFSKLEL